MKDRPLISICIPNYNNAEYVGEAIQSALDQTYNNIEVIVVDNCSTDNSWEVINTYSSDLRVKIYQNKTNIGMVGNFREALRKSYGRYISFLCSDDLIKKDTIEKLVLKLEKNSEFAFAFGNVEYIGSRKGQSNFKFHEILQKGEWIKESIKAGGNKTYLVGTVFRKIEEIPEDTIVDLVFFDWYLWLRLGKGKVAFTNNIVGCHRYHSKNQTGLLTPGILNNYYGMKEVLTLAYHNKYLSSKELMISVDQLTRKYCILLYQTMISKNVKIKEAIIECVALFRFHAFSQIHALFYFFLVLLKVLLIKFIRNRNF